jgi:glycosyltransferase involved in cell wall biosynthesis
VDLRMVATRVSDPWHSDSRCCAHSLWEAYVHADFVTYPSLCEGFGNAFLEAIYFRRPLLINRYNTFVRDIEPLGFDLVAMDGFLSARAVDQVRGLLDDPDRRDRMVRHNYRVAARHFSYTVLRRRLNAILEELCGRRAPYLTAAPAAAADRRAA